VYDISLSVAACARAGTRADVAWMIAPNASDEALAFTPGGGRIGSIASGAFDSVLADVSARQLSRGRLVKHEVTDLEQQTCGLPAGSTAEFLVVPAEQFPAEIWPALLDRQTVGIRCRIHDGEVQSVALIGDDEESEQVQALIRQGKAANLVQDDGVVTVWAPVTRLVVAGAGPIAEALVDQAQLLGWKTALEARPDRVAGISAQLSYLDAIVVMGHEVEPASRCLLAALQSEAGYIGSLGSPAMQQARADWLALQDVFDLSRVHGPAGLDIGARTPQEIAVAIAAEIIARRD
jgi:xanthine dehydrogenase accessory factor